VNRRFVLNADPAIDLGDAATTSVAPLRSSLTMPLSHEGALTGVLALYAALPDAFTDDHARLLTLLSPSLASSVVAHPNSREWMPSHTESRRSAAGELRLLKR
jgi:GAF domain-containing protein